MISLLVPVAIEGEARFVLGMALSSEMFMRLVGDLHVPADWIVSDLDRDGPFAARSRDMERFAGRQTSGRFRAVFSAEDEGAAETVSLDGTPILASFGRSSDDDLHAVISYPLVGYEGIFRPTLWWVLAAVALLGLAVAVCLARDHGAGAAPGAERPAARGRRAGQATAHGPSRARSAAGLPAGAADTRREAGGKLRKNEVRRRLAMGGRDQRVGVRRGERLAHRLGGMPDDVRPAHRRDIHLGAGGRKSRSRERAPGGGREAGARGEGGFELKHEVARPDGILRWLRTCGREFEHDEAMRLIGVCRNITIERQAKSQQKLNHRVKTRSLRCSQSPR